MMMGLRIGAGAATSGAGTGAPAAPALATGLDSDNSSEMKDWKGYNILRGN